MSSPTSSFLSLNINNITFLITKAHIKESLESLWRIECEGYIESLQEHLFALDSFTSIKNKSHITSALNNPASTLNFHPNALINKQATFRISNPYPQTHNTFKTLDFTNNPALKSLKDNIKSKNKHKENKDSITSLSSLEKVKEYQGILCFVEYLGLNPQSSANV